MLGRHARDMRSPISDGARVERIPRIELFHEETCNPCAPVMRAQLLRRDALDTQRRRYDAALEGR